MASIYIVPGYGVPADIMQDGNYRRYFEAVLQYLRDDASPGKVIIFTGGPTDMVAPYKRTEAEEMLRMFLAMKNEEDQNARICIGDYLLETKALNTVENLLLTRERIEKSWVETVDRVVVFCEYMRCVRTNRIVREVFPEAQTFPIDFDQSANRHIPKSEIDAREVLALKIELAAVRSSLKRKAYQLLCEQRLAKLRETGIHGHVAAVRKWYKDAIANLSS